ncbi:MAG: hypothetical protein ABMA00_10890 [Gemmatimonas sp.]
MTVPHCLRHAVFVVACAAASALCVSCASTGTAGGGGGTFGSRDERRTIGSFSEVLAVGVSRRYVYSATPSGIGVYDRLFNAWLPPLSRDLGFTDVQITFMTGDPVEDAVWLGVPGAVLVYRPQSEQLQRTMLTGVPDYIVFDRTPSGDAFVRASGQWTRVSRIGLATPAAGPPVASERILPRTLNDVYAAYPGLRSGSPLLFRNQLSDRSLRSFQVISGSQSLDQPNEVWFGTNGDGLYKVDATLLQATPLRFGLLERGIGALALAADGVWAAGLGRSTLRAGLTFASNDLQRWRWIDGTISVPLLGMRATAMSLRAQRAWIATDRGVVRARLDGTEGMLMWTVLDGLPDDRVLAVAAREDGAWVGTARGLVYISDTSDVRNPRTRGIGTRLLDNTPVYALLSIGDTLWIGTAGGLLALPPSGTLSRPLGVDPALRRRVTALAWSDTVLLAATDDAVLRLAPKGGVEPTRVMALDVAQVGQVTRLAMDDRTIVMAGTDGVVVLQRAGGVRVLRVPTDIPGPALDVAMSRDWLWIATPDGLVRLRRANDGGLP